MPHLLSPSKRPANYSNCPLKKRPIKYEPEDETDSDMDKSCPTSPTTSLEDMTEPENLSTKPEDLRMTGKSAQPPLTSLVAGRVVSSSSVSSSTDFKPYLQSPPSNIVSFPSALPAPPPLKPSLGPLEPISLNNRMWPSRSGIDRHFHQNIPVPSLRVHQREPISPFAASYPRDTATFHYHPYRHGSSPPHVSPPIASDQSFPPVLNLKQEQSYLAATSKAWSPHPHGTSLTPPLTQQDQRDANQHYRIIEEVPRNYNGGYTTVKTEQMCFPSPAHSQGSSGSRDSVMSHSSRSSTASSGSHSPIVPTNVNGSVRYQCPDCSKSYSTFSGLSKHLQFHCASQNKKQFVCKFCEKVYVSLGALKMHIRTHTLPCKCNVCGKAFSRPWLLQGHIRTHTGEKPFSCQHCNRAFADRSNLRAHLQTHSEVKKYSCKNCAKTFSRMSLLLKHEDNGCSSVSTC